MSKQWTDADLIQVCLKGEIDAFDDEFTAALKSRIAHSDEVRAAILESQNSTVISERIGIPIELLQPHRVNSSRTAILVLALLAASLFGFAMVLLNRERDRQEDQVAQNDSPRHIDKTQSEENATGSVLIDETKADQVEAIADSGDKPTDRARSKQNSGDAHPNSNLQADETGNGQTTPATGVAHADNKGQTGAVNTEPNNTNKTTTNPKGNDAPQEKHIWDDAFDLTKPSLTFDQAAWRAPGDNHIDEFKPETFREWFAPIRGRPFSATVDNIASSHYTRFDGMGKLKAPWVDRAVMRMAPYDITSLALYLWKGNEGVRFKVFRGLTPYLWAAHRVVRSNRHAEVRELLSSDNARWAHSHFGTFEIRVENGRAMLVRGDLPMLVVPFVGSPDEIVLEGKFKIRQLDFYRSDPVPESLFAKLMMPMGRVLIDGDVTKHAWQTTVDENSSFTKTVHDDNVGLDNSDRNAESRNRQNLIHLTAKSTSKQSVLAYLPVKDSGLCEYVFRINHGDPGTGIYLGNKDGKPLYQLGFVWDPNARQLAYTKTTPTGRSLEKTHNPETFPPPFAASTSFVRLVYGSGNMTAWISPDGEHWGWMGDYPQRSLSGRHQTVGIYAYPGGDRTIELAELRVREFDTAAKLSTPELARQFDSELFEPLDIRDFGSWMQLVVRSKPLGVRLSDWRTTCAVETLRRVPNRSLSLSLWNGILMDHAMGYFTRPEEIDVAPIDSQIKQEGLQETGQGGIEQQITKPNHASHRKEQAPLLLPSARRLESTEEVLAMLAEAALFVDIYDATQSLHMGRMYHRLAQKAASARRHSGRVVGQVPVDGDQNASEGTRQNSGSQEASDSDESRSGRLQPMAHEPPEQTNPAITTRFLTAFVNAPHWTSARFQVTPHEAAKRELMELVQQQRFDDAIKLIDELMFWNANSHPHYSWWSPVDPSLYTTVAWAELSAHSVLDSDTQTARISKPRRWKTTLTPLRHPLAQPVSKEAYNVMAEFNAALAGEAYSDACQVISSAGDANDLGLLPDRNDERLMIVFPKAVAMAMDLHPKLRTSMNEKYGAIGRLRVREAMQSGNSAQIESATVQFFGTLAAAECEQWLGDRAMAAGQFAVARRHYKDALVGYRRNNQTATADARRLISALYLVRSILGEKTDPTAELSEVDFGGQKLTAEQLRTLSKEMQDAAVAQSTSSLGQVTASPIARHVASAAPKIQAYEPQVRFRFDGDHGEGAGRSGVATVNWFARQLAYVQEGPLAYLADRFQLRCVDLTNGHTKWKQELGGEHGNTYHWPLYPMRPLVTTTHIFYRRLTKTGPELACFEKASGKVLWRFKPDSALVCDPFLIHGKLQILASRKQTTGPAQIFLITVHPQTGVVVREDQVLSLLDESQLPEHLCQATVHDDHVVFAGSGTVACCNSQGQTLWVRRQSWSPPLLDETRTVRAWTPPISLDDRVIVSQPGVRVIECLETQTGQLVWTYLAPHLRRIVGVIDQQMVIETKSGYELLDLDSGQRLWQFATTSMLDAALIAKTPASPPTPVAEHDPTVPQSATLLLARHRDAGRAKRQPELVWVNLETGKEVASVGLPTLEHNQPRMGPFVSFQNRLFVFFARGYKEANPELLEFVPKPDGSFEFAPKRNAWSSWIPETARMRQLDPNNEISFSRTVHHQGVLKAVGELCPGWTVVCPVQSADSGLKPNVNGRENVLGFKISPRGLSEDVQQQTAVAPLDAVRLIRDVQLPDNPNAALRFSVGHDKGKSWQLIVEAEGCRLHSSIIDDKSAPNGWQDINLTFGNLTGRQVHLIIIAAPIQPPQQTRIYFDGLRKFAIK